MREQTGEHWTDLLRQDLHRISRLMRADGGDEMVEGERREVAVLFLDLHGFTALSENLDHELVARIVHQVMMALARVVDGHGGYVDKFEGDLLMALFGAQHSGEDDAARAVACGLRLQTTLREISALLDFRGLQLQARVGINVGWVTVAPDPSGHLTAFGDVVNVAARMESTALIGSVQVTEGVVNRCADLFTWQDLGEIVVHGRREPVRAWRVLGPGIAQQVRWERAARVARSPLVGRECEMARLREGWGEYLSHRNPPAGGPVWLHVEGEAGMGKSRLVHEFMREIVHLDAPPLVLRGGARSFAQPALAAWLGALRQLLGEGPSTRREASQLKPRLTHLLCQAAPADADLPPGSDALLDDLADLLSAEGNTAGVVLRSGVAPERLICLFLWTLARTGRPMLIVLEDLHWLDPGSAEVLAVLLSDPDVPPFMLLSTGRNRESHNPDVELPTRGRVDIRLHALEDNACQLLLEKMLGGQATPEVQDFILGQSQGNPLYLEEQILDLVESGAVEDYEGVWRFVRAPDPDHVPLHISSLIRSRIDRLDASLVQALQRAAVVGMDVPLSVFSSVQATLDAESEAEGVLTTLERRGFLAREVDSPRPFWRFRHVVVRNAAYEMLLLVNREVLHRRVAEAIELHFGELEDPSPGMVAHHWLAAGEMERFEVWARRALDYAGRHYQHDEVERWAEQLTDRLRRHPPTLSRDRDLVDLGLKRVEALRTRQANQARRLVLEELERLCTSQDLLRERGRVRSHFARMLQDMGRLPEAKEAYGQALDLHREANDREFLPVTLFQMGTVVSEMGNSERALEFYEHSLETSREVNYRWIEGIALHNISLHAFQRGDISRGRQYVEDALVIHREVGNRMFESYALGMLAFEAAERGELVEAQLHLDRCCRLMEQTGNLGQLMMARGWSSLVARGMGQLTRAREILEKSLVAHGHLSSPPLVGSTRVALAAVLAELGEIHQATDILEHSAVLDAYLQSPRARATWLAVKGILALLEERERHGRVSPEILAEVLGQMGEVVQLIIMVKLGRNLAFAWDVMRLRQLLLEEGALPASIPWPPGWGDDIPLFLQSFSRVV